MVISLAYPSGEEGGMILVQIFSTCISIIEGGGSATLGRTLWAGLKRVYKYSVVHETVDRGTISVKESPLSNILAYQQSYTLMIS